MAARRYQRPSGSPGRRPAPIGRDDELRAALLELLDL